MDKANVHAFSNLVLDAVNFKKSLIQSKLHLKLVLSSCGKFAGKLMTWIKPVKSMIQFEE